MNEKEFNIKLRELHAEILWYFKHPNFDMDAYNINGFIMLVQRFKREPGEAHCFTFYFNDHSAAKQLGVPSVNTWAGAYETIVQMVGKPLENFKRHLNRRMVFLATKMKGKNLCFPAWFAELVDAIDTEADAAIYITSLKQQLEDNYCEVEAAIGERGVILLNLIK
jgi:hypothetical protein